MWLGITTRAYPLPSRHKAHQNQLGVVLVCDAGPGLVARKLDLYRFFRNPPRIFLVRRGPLFPTDPRLLVETQRINLPVREIREIYPLAFPLAALPVIGYLMHVFFIALRLIRRRHAIHLLHAHFIFPQGLFGLILARLCRVPFVLSAVGDDVNVMLRRNAVLRTICRFLMAQADVTIAVSLPLQRALKQFGIANTVHLPNSVDTTTIFPGGELPKSASILFVGSMTTNKRPLMLLRAFERVVTEVPEATLTMCGDGPLMQAVQDRIRQNQLDGKVRLVPRATPESVIRLLSQADVFVLPSQSEGLSNALLEAMAAGRVIVASSNESHSEILRDGVDALLFRLDDEKDLAGQIVLSLTDDQVRSRLSRSARELCLRQFSAAENGPELEKIYLATVEKYHARKRKL